MKTMLVLPVLFLTCLLLSGCPKCTCHTEVRTCIDGSTRPDGPPDAKCRWNDFDTWTFCSACLSQTYCYGMSRCLDGNGVANCCDGTTATNKCGQECSRCQQVRYVTTNEADLFCREYARSQAACVSAPCDMAEDQV
jgi:hypothetical protein